MKQISILCFLLFSKNVFPQAFSFEKCYEPLYTSGFSSITHDSAGYFYAVGSSGRAFEPGMFVKLDTNGDFLLERYFYFNDINYFRKIIPARDGNLIVVGNISGCDFGESAGLLVKITPSGNVLWSKTLNTLPLGVPGNNTPNSCTELQNGNILVVTDTTLNFFNEFGDSLYTISSMLPRYSFTDGLNNNIVCLDQSGIVILDSAGQQINYIAFTPPLGSIKLLPDSTYLGTTLNSLIKIDTSFTIINQVNLASLNLTMGNANIEPGKIWLGNSSSLNYASFDYNLQLIDSFTVLPNGVNLSSFSVFDTTLMVAGSENYRNNHSYLKSYSTSGNYTTYNTDLSLINLSFDTAFVDHPSSLPPEVYWIRFVARLTVQNTGIDTIHSFYANAESMLSGPCGNFEYKILVDSLDLAPGQTLSVPIDTLGEYGIVISNFPYVYEFCTWISCPNFKTDQDHSNDYRCDSVIFLDPTSIYDFNASGNLDIYPNPFDAEISILISDEKYKNAKYKIHNTVGEIKLTGAFLQNENTLDLSTMSPGIYFITVFTPELNISRKIIKMEK